MIERKGAIFPPCGARLGESDREYKIICPAMFWGVGADGIMRIESINKDACLFFLEDSSCPEGLNIESLECE